MDPKVVEGLQSNDDVHAESSDITALQRPTNPKKGGGVKHLCNQSARKCQHYSTSATYGFQCGGGFVNLCNQSARTCKHYNTSATYGPQSGGGVAKS